jgi:hypothetical protein
MAQLLNFSPARQAARAWGALGQHPDPASLAERVYCRIRLTPDRARPDSTAFPEVFRGPQFRIDLSAALAMVEGAEAANARTTDSTGRRRHDA